LLDFALTNLILFVYTEVVVAVVVLEAMIVSSWKTVSSFQACPST